MTGAEFSEADARAPHRQRTWVVLVDGAEHQLDLIRAEAQRRGVTIHIVIDLIHVLEYIWKAAWSLHAAGDPAAEDWVAARALTALPGTRAREPPATTPHPTPTVCTPARRTGRETVTSTSTTSTPFRRVSR